MLNPFQRRRLYNSPTKLKLYNILDRYQRSEAIADIQAFFSDENWLGEFNSKSRSVVNIGIGNYGLVFSCQVRGQTLAIKSSLCGDALNTKETAEEAYADHGEMLLDKVEPTVASFLSRRALHLCPNFCAVYAYTYGKVRIVSKNSCFAHSPRARVTMFAELGETTMRAKLKQFYAGNQLAPALSLVVQTLCALATLSAFGIAHNDLLGKNIVVAPCSGSLAYEFPKSVGRGRVALRSHGYLALLVDWGLTSQVDWLETHDGEDEILDCDPRVGTWPLSSQSLHHYYYEHTKDKLRSIVPSGMILESCEEDVCFVHPLRYTSLGHYERDVASFMTEILYQLEKTEHNSTTRALRRYCKDTLSELERRRPKSSDEFMAFVKHVTAREFFVFCSCEDLFEKDSVPPENTYRIPSSRQAEEMREELRAQLGKPALFDEILVSDCLLE